MSAISKSFINDDKRERISRIMNTDTVAGYIFALPFILGFLGFMLIPMFMSLYYSFTNLTLGRISYEWVGFANYERMWNDPRFWNSLGVTFRFVFLSVPVRMVFGLLIAYVLTRKFRGVHGYRATYYLPTLIGGSIAVALVWGQMFQRGGVIYNIIEMFGFEGIHWFGSPTLAMIPLIFMNVWQFGAAMIIFAAGIKDIPETYIEAAAIDGANKFQIFLSVPVRMVFGLLIAYVLTRKFRGVHGYRATYYLPTLIGGSIAVALVWGQMFQRGGVIYNIIEMFGFEGIHWFGSPTLAMIPLIFMNVWQFGAAMIIFAAGIKDIPETYIEAAAIDGANKFQIFFKIILPCLTPIILYNLVMQTIAAFMTFTQAFIITGGGPAEGTNFIALYIYNHAFTWRNMGYASAMSWILLLIVAVVTGIILKTSRRWTFYVNE